MPDSDLDVVLSRLNGLLLIGGPDYCPTRYGEEVTEKVHLIDPVREDFDFRLVDSVLNKSEMPILGICGGCQLLNIALGGSLFQHIEDDEVVHSNESGWSKDPRKHDVVVKPDTLLATIYVDQRISVPTSHHQAVKDVGRDLKVCANADDGVIEAIEHSLRPFTLGVQWHPERDFASNRSIFEQFIEHSQRVATSY